MDHQTRHQVLSLNYFPWPIMISNKQQIDSSKWEQATTRLSKACVKNCSILRRRVQSSREYLRNKLLSWLPSPNRNSSSCRQKMIRWRKMVRKSWSMRSVWRMRGLRHLKSMRKDLWRKKRRQRLWRDSWEKRKRWSKGRKLIEIWGCKSASWWKINWRDLRVRLQTLSMKQNAENEFIIHI